MHPTDVVGYVYRADTYCPAHTLALLLASEGIEGHGLSHRPTEAIDRLGVSRLGGTAYEDERNWDSDDFPKVIFRDATEDGRCGTCGRTLHDLPNF